MGDAGVWSSFNLGASTPTENGSYFIWGNTNAIDFSDGVKNEDKFGKRYNYTKYNSTDGLKTLEPEDDAATYLLGEEWRIPSKDEFDKLLSVCNLSKVNNYKESGVSGFLLTHKTNNNELFFPINGYYSTDDTLYSDEYVYCWLNGLHPYNDDLDSEAYIITTNGVEGPIISRYTFRSRGCGIRPIYNSKSDTPENERSDGDDIDGETKE